MRALINTTPNEDRELEQAESFSLSNLIDIVERLDDALSKRIVEVEKLTERVHVAEAQITELEGLCDSLKEELSAYRHKQ